MGETVTGETASAKTASMETMETVDETDAVTSERQSVGKGPGSGQDGPGSAENAAGFDGLGVESKDCQGAGGDLRRALAG